MTTTIQVTDNATPTPNPLAGVYAQVWATDEVTLIAGGYTNSLGQLSFASPSTFPTAYEVVVKGNLVQFPASTSISVTTDGLTFTIAGIPNTATPPSTLPLCTLFGYVYRSDGHADALTILVDTIGWDSHAQVVGGGTTTTGNPNTAMVKASKRELRSNPQTGYWSIDLVQNAKCRIYIPDMGFERFFTVPELTICNIVDLIPDAKPFYLGVLGVQPNNESIKSY